MLCRSLLSFLGLFIFVPSSIHAVTSKSGHDYISRLREAVGEWRQEIQALDASAAKAAKNLVGSGHLYTAGTQQSFVNEAQGRSGGLILAEAFSATVQLKANDVVIFGAIRGGGLEILDTLRQRVEAAGAQLIVFSSSNRPAAPHSTLFPVHPVADAKLPSVESRSNVAGLWAWFGQFIDHCVALGKTPCIFESIFMPGGTARDTPIRAYPFHAMNLAYGPNFPALGRNYLQALDTSLVHLEEKNSSAFRQAASLLTATHAANRSVTIFNVGHMFPDEFASNPVPSWITAAAPKSVSTADSLPLYLGYQWFPWEVPGLTGPGRMCSIIVTSRHPTLDWQADAQHIYIDPCWKVQDATVEISGYDIKALPASGVLESAIFW